MRRNGKDNLSLNGKIEGKSSKGRQRMTYLNNIKEWTNMANGNELFKHVRREKHGDK